MDADRRMILIGKDSVIHGPKLESLMNRVTVILPLRNMVPNKSKMADGNMTTNNATTEIYTISDRNIFTNFSVSMANARFCKHSDLDPYEFQIFE